MRRNDDAYTCFDDIALNGAHNDQNDQSAQANLLKDSIRVPNRIANYLHVQKKKKKS